MRADDYVKGNIAYHETLNPVAWEGNKMRMEVRYKLLKIAQTFIDYLDIPNFRTLDIVLTGSLANYNWTKFSDFDIHVVTEYADLRCDDIAEAFYRAKKQIWNDNHDILIRGHEAELYVEDVNEPPVSGGVYSLLDGKWLSEPSYKPPRINDRAVNIKVASLIQEIDKAIDVADDPEDIKRVTDKIRKMRRIGLDKYGEFAVENLTFKVLRNLGYLEKLQKAYTHQQDVDLGLENELEEGWKDSLTNLGIAAAIGAGSAGGMMAKQHFTAPDSKEPSTVYTVPAQKVQNKQELSFLKRQEPAKDIKHLSPEKLLTAVAKASGIVGNELAQLLAQASHETLNFTHMAEIGNSKYFATKYDPKFAPKKAKALGNTEIGDGERYKGRGFLQITGRYNYKKAGEALGLPLEKHPELLERPDIAAKAAVWFWNQRVAPNVDNFNDVKAATKKINPGLKHLSQRQEKFKQYKKTIARY